MGESINKVDFGKCTTEERQSGDHKYLFNQIVLDEDEKSNNVSYIYSRFDENLVVISINYNENLKTIEDIAKVLGSNYNEKWEDKEQGLKGRIYYDTMRNIKSEFVYLIYDDSLSWIEVSKLEIIIWSMNIFV